jgi:large subunit ribosomal protein L18
MNQAVMKNSRRQRRVLRVRKKVTGTATRPRLAVTRSVKHIAAQIIDDATGRTLCAASTDGKDTKGRVGYGGNIKAAKVVGQILGEKAKQLGIEQVCFDRRGRKYHGRIKALADAAREAGLKL